MSLPELTPEQMEQVAQRSCDMQMETLREAEKRQAQETARLITEQYGDVLKRLAKE